MTLEEYYALCVQEWRYRRSNWFKNADMRKHFSSHVFGWTGRKCGYVEMAEKELEIRNRIEVWKVGGRNWTLKPGSGGAFKAAYPKAKRRVKK